MMQSTFVIPYGATVYDREGAKIGSVREVYQEFIVVEKGWFFPTDYYIPYSAVQEAEGDRITLSVTKDEALNQGWETFPESVPPSADMLVPTSEAETNQAEGQGVAPANRVENSEASEPEAPLNTGNTGEHSTNEEKAGERS